MATPHLRATESGQVYNIDLPELKVTRDDVDGIYVLHGRGYFQTFTSREAAFDRKKEIGYSKVRYVVISPANPELMVRTAADPHPLRVASLDSRICLWR